MSAWPTFWTLSRFSAEGLFWVWPISVALGVGAIVGVVRAIARRQRPRGGWLVQAVPVVVPIIILAVGAVFACESCTPPGAPGAIHHVWAGWMVNVLSLLHVVVAVLLVTSAPGVRVASALLQAALIWGSFWAGLTASMSISGDWL